MIGPSVPADLLHSNNDSTEDEIGAVSPTVIGPQIPSSGPQPEIFSHKVIGPTLPSDIRRQYEEDEDDDYGPRPLPAGVVLEERDGVQEFLEKEEMRRKRVEEAAKPKPLKREEWMLVPPTSSDLLSSIDPTKLTRPRQFARSAAPVRDADNSLWTETPAERQQRIADEVAGKRRRAADVGADNEDDRIARKRRRHEEEIRRGVEEHTKKTRGTTLIDQHARTTSALEEEKQRKGGKEEPPAIWDHTRDMALSGRLVDDKTRDKFIKEAKGLGDRFAVLLLNFARDVHTSASGATLSPFDMQDASYNAHSNQ
ncbi:GPALPP motifs-containing protein 1 [Grifola frondosa]|uniref:GPALPP motifs-containing protein 1 n=1 Tax=Grifola frondosa TaxID=5627 RepID=A0A1C7MRK0_GRIFR|nr:GPALPP motifs-containing protein 1 [Grifola frondosa]